MGGVKNIVAPQGTAFTPEHARILKRYVDEVVLCFDSDNAGQNAAVRALDSLLGAGLSVRVAVTPPGEDPDSFIKANGGAAFKQIIDRAEGFFDYYLSRLCATNDIKTDKGRMQVVRSMAENLRKTGSDVLLDTYAQKTALRLGVSTESVRAEFKKTPKPVIKSTEAEEAPPSEEAEEPIARPIPLEFWLVKLLLHSDEHVEWIAAHLDFAWISHPTVREIVSSRISAGEEFTSVAGWLPQLDPPAQRLVTEALAESREVTGAEILLKGEAGKSGVIRTLRDKFIDRQLAAIRQQMSSPDISGSSLEELITQQAQLRSLKQQSLTPLGDSF